MAHQRKLIRAAVVARIKAANTAAGARVYANRARELFPEELPAILVYTRTEPVKESNQAPREYERTLNVSIEMVCMAENEDSLDDALDDLAEQVEAAIFESVLQPGADFGDETFGGLVSDTILGETEMELLSEGKKPIGAAKLNLAMPYFQRFPRDLTQGLDDFKKAHVEIDPASGDLVAHAKVVDDLTVPQ